MELGIPLFLAAVSVGTSAVSAVLGLGGGLILQVVLSLFLPFRDLIPVHGVIQLGSNFFRGMVLWRFLKWPLLMECFFGSLLGGVFARTFLIRISEVHFGFFMGGFILFILWVPFPKMKIELPGKFFILFVVNTFLSCLVGATGPFVAPFFLRENLKKEEIVANEAIAQGVTHLVKVVVFLSASFEIKNYSAFLLVMIGAGFLGTLIGKRFLHSLPEHFFRILFRGVVSVLALRMLVLSLLKVL